MPPGSKTASKSRPSIPSYEMLRCIGKGGYGDVWLARSVTGAFRAVKIVYRSRFDHARPFDREFLGIQRFEPISRTHRGFVDILHVGRDEKEGHFHYVMEIADDMVTGQTIDESGYVAKTLGRLLNERQHLPVNEALELGLALTEALAYLHSCDLAHRDIKPSNIIFVDGIAKFADVGLVAKLGQNSSYVGTAGYIPPEGPGSRQADIFSLGKVLYQLVMGLGEESFPELPARVLNSLNSEQVPDLLQVNEIILKACEPDYRLRFQSAEEMQKMLRSILDRRQDQTTRASARKDGDATMSSIQAVEPSSRIGPDSVRPSSRILRGLRVAILYKANVPVDTQLLQLLHEELGKAGCDVFYDRHLVIGVEWAREIESNIRKADAVVVLLSSSSIQSEMLAYEVEIAQQITPRQPGRPQLLPVRVQFNGPLPPALACVLGPLQQLVWDEPKDDGRLVAEIVHALENSPVSSISPRIQIESIGGAVPLDSKFYIVRPTDQEFQHALARRDSIVLVKGARQMGKTSLLARGLQQARQSGAKVALTDFQKLNAKHLQELEAFYLALGEFMADQLDLSVLPKETWDKRRSPNTNFERYLRREVLSRVSGHFVWGLDEVDRLFTCSFGSEVFGLFRSWHNERALDPQGPWSRLTLAIAYATEAHLFITDLNQSPFNVGTRLMLDDFSLAQVADLNRRYDSPLRSGLEVQEFHALLGGQPYLVRRGFNDLAAGKISFAAFKTEADRDEGIFGDHLRRMLLLLAKDPELSQTVREILDGRPNASAANFYRLRSAGLMRGDSPEEIHPRCEIYASYLKRHLR